MKSKKTRKYLLGLGLLMALAGKPVNAQNSQNVSAKPVGKEKTLDKEPNVFDNDTTGKFVEFGKNPVYFEPQVFSYVTKDGPGFCISPVCALSPSMNLWNGRINIAARSTGIFTNFGSKEIRPLIPDAYASIEFYVDKNKEKSVRLKGGKYSPHGNYAADAGVSHSVPIGVELLTAVVSNSGYYQSMAATAEFRSKHFYVGAGLGSSETLKWSGERNIVVFGGYDVFGGDELKIGGTVTYNTGNFGEEFQLGGKFANKFKCGLQIKAGLLEPVGTEKGDGSGALYEWNYHGNSVTSFHVLWSYANLFASNVRVSVDFYKYGIFMFKQKLNDPSTWVEEPKDNYCSSSLSVCYIPYGAYVCFTLGNNPLMDQHITAESSFPWSIETGVKIPVSKLMQLVPDKGAR